MNEYVVNLHMHTRYSDGGGLHQDIVKAAITAGVDAVIVTDHNVLVQGVEGYYTDQRRRVLLLIGEEIHDQAREPQKNHMLIIGADREMSTAAADPQALIDQARAAGGLSFIAHPFDPASPLFNEPDISWVDWSVHNFTGIELWNALSELKSRVPTKLHAIFLAYFPEFLAQQPPPSTVQRWDALLAEGRKVVAIGGSDAHAMKLHLGPLGRIIFPYEFHFRGINTHVILLEPLVGEAGADRRSIYSALGAGRCFIGYDLPASTRGFRFTAQGREGTAAMGEEITARGGVTLQAWLPAPGTIRLIKDGAVLHSWPQRQACTHITVEPGAYRIEAYRQFLGSSRGWIFSNPIYVT
jgi:hypothetical protein